MDFHETKICFKEVFEVSIFAEISDLPQKFLPDCLSWIIHIFKPKYQLSGGLPWSVEISGRQNYANVVNLAQFAQNERKNHQMLKNDDFDHFEGTVIFENFWPKVKIFKKSRRAVEISALLTIIGTVKINIKKLFKTSGRVFWPILTSWRFWE